MPVLTLDANVVRNTLCPSGKKKIDLYDTAITGFILEVRSTGTKTYYLKYRNARKQQRQYKIGDEKSLTFSQANQVAKKLRARVVLGDDPVNERADFKKIMMIDEFVHDRYLPFVKGYKKSWDCDESLLRVHIIPYFGKRYLDEIFSEELVAFQQVKRAAGYAPGTINRMVVLLRYLFNLALKWEVIPNTAKNPATETPLLKDSKRERYLSSEEAQVLVETVKISKNPQLKFIVPLLLLLGCRKRELLDAEWSHFDIGRRLWRIPKSKTGVRHVPLSHAVLDLFTQLPRWDTARKQAGMPELRVHDLRHSLASFLVNSGRNIYEVMQILGHSDIHTTQRYSHLSQSTLLDAVDSVVGVAGLDLGSVASL